MYTFREMSTADTIALISLIVSILGFGVSIAAFISADRNARRANTLEEKANLLDANANLLSEKANNLTEKTNSISIEIAQRDKTLDLWSAWQGVSDIDVLGQTSTPIWPDVIRVQNALELTASCWNHSVVQREIIFQSYWKTYKDLYGKLEKSPLNFPDGRGPVRDLISPEMKRAYHDMEQCEIQRVKQTTYS